MRNNKVRVIIINFNAGDALLRSVASVLSTREPLNLVVADNASSDDSCEKLRSLHGGNQRLEIVENSSNMGFSRAVNALAMQAEEPYLLILNPDCELYPGTLAALRQALEQDQDAALASPRMVDEKEQTLKGALRTFPSPWKAVMTATGLAHLGSILPFLRGVELQDPGGEEVKRVDAVSGACMMMRSDRFRLLNGLDEAYEMHFEDLDLMYRIQKNHWFCLYAPAARAYHMPGISSRSRPTWVHFHKHRGMQRFFSKHQASEYSPLSRGLFHSMVWVHFLLTLPQVWLNR